MYACVLAHTTSQCLSADTVRTLNALEIDSKSLVVLIIARLTRYHYMLSFSSSTSLLVVQPALAHLDRLLPSSKLLARLLL